MRLILALSLAGALSGCLEGIPEAQPLTCREYALIDQFVSAYDARPENAPLTEEQIGQLSDHRLVLASALLVNDLCGDFESTTTWGCYKTGVLGGPVIVLRADLDVIEEGGYDAVYWHELTHRLSEILTGDGDGEHVGAYWSLQILAGFYPANVQCEVPASP